MTTDSTRSRILEVMARAEASFEEVSYAKYRELFKEQAAHILAALSAEGMSVVPVAKVDTLDEHIGALLRIFEDTPVKGESDAERVLQIATAFGERCLPASPYEKASMQEASAERAARSEQKEEGK